MVERGDEPGKGEGMVLEDRTGKGETQMFGCRGHSRDQQHGVVHRCLRGLGQGRLSIAPKHVVHAHDIGQEQGIELAPFQHF